MSLAFYFVVALVAVSIVVGFRSLQGVLAAGLACVVLMASAWFVMDVVYAPDGCVPPSVARTSQTDRTVCSGAQMEFHPELDPD